MGTVEVSSPWFTPGKPKCRNCVFWDGFLGGGNWLLSAPCTSLKAKVKNALHRPHNAKACSCFKRRA